MTFLFVAPRYHTNLHFQIKALVDHGHLVYFWSLYRGGAEYYEAVVPKVLGFSSTFLFLNRLFNSSGGRLIKNNFELKYGYPPLFDLLRRQALLKPEVVVIKNIASLYSLIVAAFAKLSGSRVIFLVQIPKHRPKTKSFSVFLVGCLFGAKVITPVLGETSFKNKNDNLIYIPFSYPEVTTLPARFVSGPVKIICVGKFQERKDQLSLVEVLNTLKNKHDWRLTLIGQDDEEIYIKKMHQYITSHNLANLITIKTDLPWERVQEDYVAHDLFVLPSYLEAASCAVLEAMAHGLPVLTSDDNGTMWYVRPGVNGEHFRARDKMDLLTKLNVLLGDRSKLLAMGQASLDIVKRDHLPEKFYEQFIGIL